MKKRNHRWLLLFVANAFLLFSNGVLASHQHQLEKITQKAEPPEGVVFEILSRRENYLEWAIPEVQKMVERLRSKYPEIPLAVVSHSREQFALTTKNAEKYSQMHGKVKSLVTSQDIPVHVCGVNAERRGLRGKDFPDYVDVSESGPIQVGLYRELGYVVIMISGH